MRERLELALAVGIGVLLAALPLLHFGVGAGHAAGTHHHGTAPTVAAASSHH